MYPQLIDQLVSQQVTEIRTGARRANRFARAQRKHRHPLRRRTGYALVSLGLRLAYAAGED